MKKGEKFEQEYSLIAHQRFLPVLVSSLLLRSIGAGQVDVAGLDRKNKTWVLRLFEVKSKVAPTILQWRRLQKTQDYLSKMLEIESKLEVKFCQKAEP
jgi:hypothetical protein